MADYYRMAIHNQNWLSIFKIYRSLPFFWYEDHSDQSTYTWVTTIWKWQYFETLVKMNNNVNGTLTKWLISPWWRYIIEIGFQYSKSTDSYLYFDIKIIQISPQTMKLQPFENCKVLWYFCVFQIFTIFHAKTWMFARNFISPSDST